MKKKILYLFVTIIIVITLTGCSFNFNKAKKTTKKTTTTEKISKKISKKAKKEVKKTEKKDNMTKNSDAIVGKYTLISLTDNETTYEEDVLEELRKSGFEVTIEFGKEKKGKLSLGDESNNFSYDNKYIDFGEEKASYEIEDNILTLKENTQTLIFKRIK